MQPLNACTEHAQLVCIKVAADSSTIMQLYTSRFIKMATLQFFACFLLLAVGSTNAWRRRFRPLPAGAQIGDDCTSTIANPSRCGEPVLIGSTETPVTNIEGPNVCTETRMYMQQTCSYTYQQLCSRRRCFTSCKANGCNGTMVNFTRSALKCCDGFAEGDPMPAPGAAGSSFSRFFRRFGYRKRSSSLRTNGCPVELRETVAECLEELGLNSFLSEVVAVPGLEDRLSSEDEASTVFALSDEVFEGLSDLDRALLFSVSAHIGEGQIPEKKLSGGRLINTLVPNATIHVAKTGNRTVKEYFVNGIRISETNACQARNGVVHIVDGIIPTSSATINGVLVAQSARFSIFQNLLNETGVARFLDDPVKSRTVFAPTNEAFDEYPGLADCLRNPSNSRYLSQFVLIHISSPAEYTATLSRLSRIPTFTYWSLRVNSTDEGIFITNDAIPLSDPNIPANNGVIHAIPEVILPFSEARLNRICPDIGTTMAPTTTEPPSAIIIEPEATPDPDGIPSGGIIIPPESVGR